MKSCLAKKLLFSFLLLNYLVAGIFALETEPASKKGAELSEFVEQSLQNSGVSTQKIELSSTGNDIFAYNISIFFNSTDKSKTSEPKTLLILFSQNDYPFYEKQILDLLETVKKTELSFPVQFVFTALDDRNSTLDGYEFFLEGTQNFAQSIDSPDDYFAILVSFSNSAELKQKAKIFTTGGKNSTPLWLTKETVNSFLNTSIDFSVPQKFLAIYRAGLLFGDDDMASFFRENVPNIKIEFSAGEQLCVLKNFVAMHEPSLQQKNDVHYSFFAAGTFKAFWFSEFFNIVSLEIFGGFVILFLVCFTFTGKKRIHTKRDFSRFWFVIPLLLALSVLSLYAGQLCCEKIQFINTANPVIQFASKLFVSILVISVLFLFQSKLSLPDTEFVYSFMTILVSTANVFLFSMADITVFWVFAVEYLIVYFMRNARKIWALCICAFLMLLPFLSYVAVYFANVNDEDIKVLIYSGTGTNILLSLVLFPFQMVWLKALIRLNKINKEKSLTFKKFAKFTFFSLAIITVLIGIFTFLMTQFFYNKKHNQKNHIQYVEKSAQDIALSAIQTKLPELNVYNLKINSKKQAVRYTIVISGENASPVLDSLYSFTVKENSRQVEFNIPDYPPQQIDIEFSTEKSVEKVLTLTAIYETENQNVYEREVLTEVLPGEKN